MEQISLTINRKTIHCPPETTIFDAAKENGIKIPSLCNHPHLTPVGACRLCIVEDEKSGRIFASCVTPVSQDMSLRTDTPVLKRYRSDIVKLMIANHPESCILCNQGNRCELRQIAADLGVGATGLYPIRKYIRLEEANPFIIRDLTKCILCGRCIRADHDLVQVGAIDYNLRGFHSFPTTVHGQSLEKSECTFCGTCVSLCPTGALTTKIKNHAGSPQRQLRTVCGFCGVGCTLKIGLTNNTIVEVYPSHEDETVNLSTLCVRGHFIHDYLNTSSRLTRPLIRQDNGYEPVSWEQAYDLIVEKLLGIKKDNGPQSICFLGSSKCSNEENYLFQKMARVIFETNNIDNGGYLSGRSGIMRLNERLDGGDHNKPLSDLERAELLFVLGSDPTHSVPVAGYYIKRAARLNQVPLIVADSRKTGLSPFASVLLQIAPEADYELINTIASLLYQQKAYDKDYIEKYTTGFDLYASSLAEFNLERAAKKTEIEKEDIEKTVALMKGKRIAFLVGQGVLQQQYSADVIDALINLSLMTGSLGGHNSGFYILAKDANQNGSIDMGSAPDLLPGCDPLYDESIRKHWQKSWNVTLSPDPGLDMVRMIEEAEKGNIKALYIIGENLLRSLPQPERVREALSNLDFLIVQDILSTETVNIADVVLPGAAFCEKQGSFTNMEGRIQFFEPAIPPPGGARPDWVILDQLLERLGTSKKYESIQQVRSEIGELTSMYKNINESGRCVWVNEKSRMKLFKGDTVGELIPFTKVTTIETKTSDNEYPLKAILTSTRFHLGNGTRTSFSERIRDFGIKGDIEMSLKDCDRLKLEDGDQVRISSPHGTIFREIRRNKTVKEGTVYIPKGFSDNDVMQLVNLNKSGKAKSPGLKYCDVKVEKAG